MRNPQTMARLRPVDLARMHGLSTQAIRNYEEAGILPPAQRTPNGYRVYTPLHAQALLTFLALVPGHGHPASTSIMRSVNEDAIDEALRLVDDAHMELQGDHATLRAVETAFTDLQAGAPTQAPPGRTFIGPLAHRLGIKPATLRKWESVGLVQPHRDPQTGYRVYTEIDVRDAQLIRQLRRGGYLLEQIAPFIVHIRSAGGLEPLETLLNQWHDRLSFRGRAMLTGAAQLDAYLRAR